MRDKRYSKTVSTSAGIPLMSMMMMTTTKGKSSRERVTAERDLCSKSYALMHKLCPREVSNVVSYGCIHGKRTYEFNARFTLKL